MGWMGLCETHHNKQGPGRWDRHHDYLEVDNNDNNNKACPVGTRGEVANLWRESVQAQFSISIFLPSCPGSAESSR